MDAETTGVPASRVVDIALSALFVLLVAVPTMAIEEDWHGKPMIDQATHLWLVAVVLVVAAFFVGGLVAAFRRPATPVRVAAAAALLAVGALVAGAVFRRVWLAHEGTSSAVRALWCLGGLGAVATCVVGALVGRQLTARLYRGHHVRQRGR